MENLKVVKKKIFTEFYMYQKISSNMRVKYPQT